MRHGRTGQRPSQTITKGKEGGKKKERKGVKTPCANRTPRAVCQAHTESSSLRNELLPPLKLCMVESLESEAQ